MQEEEEEEEEEEEGVDAWSSQFVVTKLNATQRNNAHHTVSDETVGPNGRGAVHAALSLCLCPLFSFFTFLSLSLSLCFDVVCIGTMLEGTWNSSFRVKGQTSPI